MWVELIVAVVFVVILTGIFWQLFQLFESPRSRNLKKSSYSGSQALTKKFEEIHKNIATLRKELAALRDTVKALDHRFGGLKGVVEDHQDTQYAIHTGVPHSPPRNPHGVRAYSSEHHNPGRSAQHNRPNETHGAQYVAGDFPDAPLHRTSVESLVHDWNAIASRRPAPWQELESIGQRAGYNAKGGIRGKYGLMWRGSELLLLPMTKISVDVIDSEFFERPRDDKDVDMVIRPARVAFIAANADPQYEVEKFSTGDMRLADVLRVVDRGEVV